MSDEETRAREAILGVCLRFEECNTCGNYHRADFTGDCREPAHRFTRDRLDRLYPDIWVDQTEEHGHPW